MDDMDGDAKRGERTDALVFDYDLDAPPEKVWRAISLPAFRDKWLPGGDLAEAEPVSASPGEEIRYRMREDAPPFLESVVTFRIGPNAMGGTWLRIVHGLADRQMETPPSTTADNDGAWLMRAA